MLASLSVGGGPRKDGIETNLDMMKGMELTQMLLTRNCRTTAQILYEGKPKYVLRGGV